MLDKKILNGKILSQQIKAKIKLEIDQIKAHRQPCLAVILVGNDKASEVYVRNKKNACNEVGITSSSYELPDTTTQNELLNLIEQLNHDNTVDGILIQLPVPNHIDSKLIINAINPQKDVDGFHPQNMGRLASNDPLLCPCTPHGVMYMLDSINIKYHGLRTVVIGASNIVGRPMALELLNRGATVTLCNSKTVDLPSITRQADLIVVGIGKPRLIEASWVKPKAVVIDVGINRLADGTLCGDVDYDNVYQVASYITPVPGGVGPMTIAMLMQNTLQCYHMLAKTISG